MIYQKSQAPRALAVTLLGAGVGFCLAWSFTDSTVSAILFSLLSSLVTAFCQLALDLYFKVIRLGEQLKEETSKFIVSEMSSHVDIELRSICEHGVDYLLDSAKRLLEDKEICVLPGAMFTRFYINALEKYKRGEFTASAHYGENYVWEEELRLGTMEYAINERKRTGTMKRIFFIYDRDLKDPDFVARRQKVKSLQVKIGVEVQEVLVSKVREMDLPVRFVMSTPKSTLSWEVLIQADGAVDKVVATADRDRIDRDDKYLRQVWSMAEELGPPIAESKAQ